MRTSPLLILTQGLSALALIAFSNFITGDLVSIRRVDESGQPVTDPLILFC